MKEIFMENTTFSAGIKVNNKNTRTRGEIFLYFTPCFSVSIVKFEHVIAA